MLLQGSRHLIPNMHLIPNVHLIPNMRLIVKGKIDHTPKPRLLFGSLNSLGLLLHVDLVFTVESAKSVSCDAMTNVGFRLDENS